MSEETHYNRWVKEDLIEEVKRLKELTMSNELEVYKVVVRDRNDEIKRLEKALEVVEGKVIFEIIEWAGKTQLEEAEKEIEQLRENITTYQKITSEQSTELVKLRVIIKESGDE